MANTKSEMITETVTNKKSPAEVVVSKKVKAK